MLFAVDNDSVLQFHIGGVVRRSLFVIRYSSFVKSKISKKSMMPLFYSLVFFRITNNE